MDSSNKDGERSGYTSPDVPPTPATSHLGGKLRRTASEETLATTFSGVSSTPSLIYPAPPLNTPATQSVVGDNESLAANMKGLAEQLERASLSPPASPASTNAEVGDPFKEDRAATPTLLSFIKRAPETDTDPDATHEFSTWGPVAEEDTERALKRMAMLARDEHKINPQYSVEEHYSMRLAKLIEDAEVEFDASKLH